jgi:hypothetical protein
MPSSCWYVAESGALGRTLPEHDKYDPPAEPS